MYPVSAEYKQKIASGEEQIFLALFNNKDDNGVYHPMYLTNEDIDISSGGIRYTETFNTDEDFGIGGTPSAELALSVFNDEGEYTDFEFGLCRAFVGVYIKDTTYTRTSGSNTDVYVRPSNIRYTGWDTTPYLRKSGSAYAVQPTFPVKAIWATDIDNLMICFGENNQYCIIDYGNDTLMNAVLNDTMIARGMEDVATNTSRFFSLNASNNRNRMQVFDHARHYKLYEFCPLGEFRIDRPNCANGDTMDLVCYDRMQDFEIDMPTDAELGITYPASAYFLLTKMADYLGITLGNISSTNLLASIESRPSEFNTSTMRVVLGWLAEMMCGIAKFDRDGNLCIKFYNDISATAVFDEHNYEAFEPYYYQVPTVDKVVRRKGSTDVVAGTGDNGLLILNNPLLADAET